MPSVLVIGAGPAGISAAVYAARAGAQVRVLHRDGGALGRVRRIDNYYGFSDPIDGASLFDAGCAQARRLGVTILQAEALGLSFEERLVVETADGRYDADRVILATGAARKAPKIDGIERLEGRGVSFCAVCDGFFFKNQDVAVLGAGAYALREAEHLLPLCRSVTLLTNGEPVPDAFPEGLALDPRPIQAIQGAGAVSGVSFADGAHRPITGLFVALGVAGSFDLARKLGAETERDRVVVDAAMQTTVPGLYAAGDCTGGLKQIAKAVYEGMLAGMAAAK